MSKFPRRSFLAGLSTIPFALWFEKYAAAAPAMIRYNVTSVNGQKMLKIYRDGVKLMVATAEPNPVGWLFEWYTHNVLLALGGIFLSLFFGVGHFAGIFRARGQHT